MTSSVQAAEAPKTSERPLAERLAARASRGEIPERDFGPIAIAMLGAMYGATTGDSGRLVRVSPGGRTKTLGEVAGVVESVGRREQGAVAGQGPDQHRVLLGGALEADVQRRGAASRGGRGGHGVLRGVLPEQVFGPRPPGGLDADISAWEAQTRAGAQPTPMAVEAFGAFLARDIERQRDWIKLARIEAN